MKLTFRNFAKFRKISRNFENFVIFVIFNTIFRKIFAEFLRLRIAKFRKIILTTGTYFVPVLKEIAEFFFSVRYRK
jgi:hypothetical protein